MKARVFPVILIWAFGTLSVSTVHGQDAPQSSDFYGDISVTASGVKEVTGERISLQAEVYINGRFVGQTPYSDGLPRGKYEVRLEAGSASKRYPVDVKPGEQYEIKAELPVALTDGERLEMARAENEADQKQRQEQIAYYQEAYDLWRDENDAVQKKRKPLLLTSGLLMGAGAAMTIAGIVFLSKFKNQQENYDDADAVFLRATDPADIEYYRSYLARTEKGMKQNKVLAAVFLPTGIVSLIGSLVFLGLAPKKPGKPNIPFELKGYITMATAPVVFPGGGGLSVTGTF